MLLTWYVSIALLIYYVQYAHRVFPLLCSRMLCSMLLYIGPATIHWSFAALIWWIRSRCLSHASIHLDAITWLTTLLYKKLQYGLRAPGLSFQTSTRLEQLSAFLSHATETYPFGNRRIKQVLKYLSLPLLNWFNDFARGDHLSSFLFAWKTHGHFAHCNNNT